MVNHLSPCGLVAPAVHRRDRPSPDGGDIALGQQAIVRKISEAECRRRRHRPIAVAIAPRCLALLIAAARGECLSLARAHVSSQRMSFLFGRAPLLRFRSGGASLHTVTQKAPEATLFSLCLASVGATHPICCRYAVDGEVSDHRNRCGIGITVPSAVPRHGTQGASLGAWRAALCARLTGVPPSTRCLYGELCSTRCSSSS